MAAGKKESSLGGTCSGTIALACHGYTLSGQPSTSDDRERELHFCLGGTKGKGGTEEAAMADAIKA